MKINRAFALLLFASVLLPGCNLPSSGGGDQQAVSQTLTAIANGAPQPGPGIPSETPGPTTIPTQALTSTPTIPVVSVSQNTNCRSGPGIQYDLISSLLIGQTAEVVGKNSGVPNYWVIKNPEGSGTCWLWGQYATVAGNTAALPEIPVPPTPTPSPTATPAAPKPPKDPSIVKICVPIPGPLFQYLGTFNWVDKSDNEDGFHVYLNGALFGTTGPDAVSYPLPGLIFPPGTALKMGVDAFNAAGVSVKKEVTFSCP